MSTYIEELAAAADWIWKHRDEPQYWEWHDLTARNPASDTLNMPDTIAWNIFTILQERNLMIPFKVTKDGKTFQAFKINLSNDREWEKARKAPSACQRYLWQPLKKLGISFWVFLFWILSLIIASSLTYGIKRFIDLNWPLPK